MDSTDLTTRAELHDLADRIMEHDRRRVDGTCPCTTCRPPVRWVRTSFGPRS